MSNPLRAEYVIISHRPSINRTEHLHIGIVVRTAQGWRAHLAHDLRKLRAIDPEANAEALRDLQARIPQWLQGCQDWQCARQKLRFWGLLVSDGEPGSMLYTDEADYLKMVQAALRSQVLPPPRKRELREGASRLHLDLRRSFAARGWLGRDIMEHQIVERYHLDGPMVTAEFALRNGRLHVLETIDLRGSNVAAKRADVRAKALVLDVAADMEHNCARYAVIAGIDSPLADEADRLMRRYASDVLHWESQSDMEYLMSTLAKAVGKPDITPPPAG